VSSNGGRFVVVFVVRPLPSTFLLRLLSAGGWFFWQLFSAVWGGHAVVAAVVIGTSSPAPFFQPVFLSRDGRKEDNSDLKYLQLFILFLFYFILFIYI
jgi:hypothetical protein